MDKNISVGRLDQEKAAVVGDLFRAVYGEEYPAAYVYDPDKLWAENQTGDTYSVLAFTEDGEAVGHLAIFRSAPSPKVYELGQLLVLPRYRGSGIGDKLTEYVTEVLIKEVEVDAVFCESVCHYAFSQKIVASRGYVDTALEVGLMPAQAYKKEQSSTGRVTCLLQFKEENLRSQRVYLPGCYQSELMFCYEGLSTRKLQEAVFSLPEKGETVGREKVFALAGVARIAVETIGADFPAYVLKLEKLAREKKIQAMQIYLPLHEPTVGGAVAILQEKGFFLGGILPYWFGGDGLLMQKLWNTNPAFAECQLYTVKAGKIRTLIQADWEKSMG